MPAARSRLWAIAAHSVVQAELAPKCPEGRWARGPSMNGLRLDLLAELSTQGRRGAYRAERIHRAPHVPIGQLSAGVARVDAPPPGARHPRHRGLAAPGPGGRPPAGLI